MGRATSRRLASLAWISWLVGAGRPGCPAGRLPCSHRADPRVRAASVVAAPGARPPTERRRLELVSKRAAVAVHWVTAGSEPQRGPGPLRSPVQSGSEPGLLAVP